MKVLSIVNLNDLIYGYDQIMLPAQELERVVEVLPSSTRE